MGRLTKTELDFDGDRVQASIPVTDAADDGTDYATWFSTVDALNTAIDAVLRTASDVVNYASKRVENNPSRPTSPDAQGSDVWVLEFSIAGMSGGPYTISLPGADRSLGISRNGRVELDLSTGAGATLKTNFEAAYLYPGTLDNPGAANAGEATLDVVYVRRT